MLKPEIFMGDEDIVIIISQKFKLLSKMKMSLETRYIYYMVYHNDFANETRYIYYMDDFALSQSVETLTTY